MNVPSKDRRIRRTQRMLKQGLATLMLEKEFNAITVRDITDYMDLNRGTFYLHYTDTYDLLQHLENDTLSDVQEMIDKHKTNSQAKTLLPIFEPILNYIIENKQICRSLMTNTACGDFIRKVYDLIYQNGVDLIHAHFPNADANKFEYLFSFVTYGLIGLIKQSFDNNMETAKEEILYMADTMVTAAAEKVLI